MEVHAPNDLAIFTKNCIRIILKNKQYPINSVEEMNKCKIEDKNIVKTDINANMYSACVNVIQIGFP